MGEIIQQYQHKTKNKETERKTGKHGIPTKPCMITGALFGLVYTLLPVPLEKRPSLLAKGYQSINSYYFRNDGCFVL